MKRTHSTTRDTLPPSSLRWRSRALLLAAALLATGCRAGDPSAHIIFLDGAGYFGSATQVKHGLRRAGYRGAFEGFVWTSFLGWGVDHLVTANSTAVAHKLARRIERIRSSHPDGYVALMGLSAGSAVILAALEQLPDNQSVDDVVLFQPSVASDRELTPALRHVRHRLIATYCRWDAILAALAISADQRLAKPAGQIGFKPPRPMSPEQRRQYIKLLSIPWRKRYASAGWGGIKGWHVSSTNPTFVERYIAPYILTSVKYARSRAYKRKLDAHAAQWEHPTARQSPRHDPNKTGDESTDPRQADPRRADRPGATGPTGGRHTASGADTAGGHADKTGVQGDTTSRNQTTMPVNNPTVPDQMPVQAEPVEPGPPRRREASPRTPRRHYRASGSRRP